MLKAVPEQPGDQPSTNSGSSLQQPRSDLQPTTAQNQTAAPQQTPTSDQQNFNADALRVGSSQTLIPNTTSTPQIVANHHNYMNAAWLWMIVPLVLAGMLFWPRKRARKAASGDGLLESIRAEMDQLEPEPELEAAAPAPVATRPTKHPKKKKTAKKTKRK